MIFLTVGTQVQFDRLVRAVDRWCAQAGNGDVFGQLALPEGQGYKPRHFDWVSFMQPGDYERRFEESDIVVAHAGMGSIITAMMQAKPILMMPRRAALGEQRNDHQLATVRRFGKIRGVSVAMDEDEVPEHLSRLVAERRGEDAGRHAVSPYADARLIREVRRVIMCSSAPVPASDAPDAAP